MIRTGKTALAVFLSLVIIVMIENGNCEETVKVKLATGEYTPYASAHMKDYGLVAEIITETFKEMGLEHEYFFYPWKRCELLVKHGKIWATFPYGYTEERTKKIFFSDVLLVTSTKFFYYKKHQKNKISWNTIEDLKPYKIGGVLGYYYEKEFKRSGINVDYAPSEKLTLKKLVYGRVYLFPADVAVAWNLIKKHFPREIDNFGMLEKPHETSGNYLMVSKTYPNTQELLQKFNAALKKIKDRGVVKQILQKYNIREH
ncbi:MAG: amino acid ABC transporter substrate-binding protein [Desulfobacteraceae bacterium]|nr:amino acid ABC transporter substrate-binding protein [Desulfobacteraceae bacterium]